MLTLEQDSRRNVRCAAYNGQPMVDLQSFADTRNSCRGPVFIVASGPSAAEFPLEQYRHIPMMAMNGSLLRLQQAGIQPFFYLCDDPRFVKSRTQVVVDAAATARHIGLNAPSLERLLQLRPDCTWHAKAFLLERVNRAWQQPRQHDRCYAWSVRHDPELLSSFSLFRSKPNRLGFSTNMAKGYYSARTIPYAALQLACHLGFSHALLVGLDLNPTLGRCYAEGDKVLKSTLDIDYDDFILPSFAFMQAHLPTATRFQVFNLSPISRLPDSVVPRLTPDTLDRLLTTVADT